MKYADSLWKKRNPLLLLPLVALGTAGLVLYPQDAAFGASAGLDFCLYTLIPSTFCFLVLSCFCVCSGLAQGLERPLGRVTRLLFHLPGCCGPAILLSLVGGYPVGARSIAALYQQGSITQKQAQRMLYFCVNAGPAFSISVIGSCLYGVPQFGVYLFLSLSAASLLMGIALGVCSRFRDKQTDLSPPVRVENAPAQSMGNALVSSAGDASRAMVGCCSFVLLFSTALSLLNAVGLSDWISHTLVSMGISDGTAASIFPMLWEVGGGCLEASYFGASIFPVVFGVSFGGLCVHFQVLAFAGGFQPCRWKFFLSRILHALLSTGIFALLTKLFPLPLPEAVVSVFHNTTQPFSGALSATGVPMLRAVAAAVVLLLLCLVLILSNVRQKGQKIG